jgi:tRNA threonylcarbamoyladenosine biosynthesis protein TsaE
MVSYSNFISQSEQETRDIAARFARSIQGNEKIYLFGPLGSGKTSFVRGFVESFGISPSEVSSPTFTLVREYGKQKKIYHVDLYRFDKEEEIFEAGIYEILTGDDLVLVEWADRLKRYYPEDAIRIEFAHAGESQRQISIFTTAAT